MGEAPFDQEPTDKPFENFVGSGYNDLVDIDACARVAREFST